MKKWQKNILEFVAHFAWAFIALLPVAITQEWWTGFLSGVLLALPRELVDQWPIERPLDTVVDLLAFGLGGMLVIVVCNPFLG